jgi:hypothetical protein
MKRAFALFVSMGAATVALLLTAQPAHTQGSLGPAPIVNVTTGGGLTKTGQKVGMTLCAAGETPVMNGGGTAWTCGTAGAGDIEGVTAGAGMTGGGTSGTVTLDVACATGLTCNANDIAITSRDFGDITASSSGSVWTIDNSVVTSAKLNITATSACSAGQYINAISSSAAGSCVAEVGDISSVVAGAGMTGGATSGAATVDVVGTTNSITVNADSIEIASRDFGDITVGSTGTTMTVDNSTITSAKLNITTTSCSAGQHVSAISAGGVGTCTASGGLSGLTSGTIPIATSSTTIGDSLLTYSASTWTMSGTLNASGSVTGGTGVFASSFATGIASYGLAYALGTNSAATGCINCVGYNEGTTQTRSLRIADGTGSAGGDTIAFFDGTDRSVDFSAAVNVVGDVDVDGDLTLGTTTSDFVQVAGFLEVDSTLGVDGATRLGDADSDTNASRGVFGFTGTDVSVSSGNCTVAGEAQAFTITLSGDLSTGAPCVIALNRTITGNRCVGSPANAAAAGFVASLGYSVTQSTTTASLAPGSSTMNSGVWNVQCFGDHD